MGGSGGGAAPSGGGAAVGTAAPTQQAGAPHRPVSVPYLHEARSMLRAEVQTAVRCIRLLESTFFGSWKMEALLLQVITEAMLLRRCLHGGTITCNSSAGDCAAVQTSRHGDGPPSFPCDRAHSAGDGPSHVTSPSKHFLGWFPPPHAAGHTQQVMAPPTSH